MPLSKSACHGVYCALSNLQSWNFCCRPAHNKISADCIWEVYSHWNYHRNDWYHWGERRRKAVNLGWSSIRTFHIHHPSPRLISGNKIVYTLTPTDKWHSNKELGGSFTEHNDQLLEHEHSLCPHQHHSSQREVVDQNRHSHTPSVHMCLVNAAHKDNQHTK